MCTEDILWFKPVELKTKQGKRGHIKEALGELVAVVVRSVLVTWNPVLQAHMGT